MQHKIDPDKHGPRGEAMADAVQACVHCGFCLAACPTYHVLGEEMDSPRGRIYLMKNVLEGELDAKEAEPYIDRCLGCMGCVPACPSGVAYGDLLTSYRAAQEKERKRPLSQTIQRKAIIETLPHPNRFRVASKVGKIGKVVQSALPKEMQAMLNLLPQRVHPAQNFPAVVPAQGEKRATVALLTGCVQTVLAPNINDATIALLSYNGVEVIIPQQQGCCGSILMHIGEAQKARSLVQHNLVHFPLDVDAIVTNAAGCGSGMQEYELLLKGTPDEAKAHRFAEKVMDVSLFLGGLGIRPFPQNQPNRTIIYHDACHLAHAQGVVEPPRDLLRQIPNLTLLEVGDGGLCCGSAGTYNLEQPEIAHQLGKMKAQRIIDSGAEQVVTGNIGCMMQIRPHLNALGNSLPVKHTVELLWEAVEEKGTDAGD